MAILEYKVIQTHYHEELEKLLTMANLSGYWELHSWQRDAVGYVAIMSREKPGAIRAGEYRVESAPAIEGIQVTPPSD